jgi:hypothetical protein
MWTDEQVYMAFRVIKQGATKKVEVCYKRILKLANFLEHKVDANLLTVFFNVGLVLYLRVATTHMKCNSLFKHKEVVITCEKSMGDPIEYQKLLEPPKLDENNDGKRINLVCS